MLEGILFVSNAQGGTLENIVSTNNTHSATNSYYQSDGGIINVYNYLNQNKSLLKNIKCQNNEGIILFIYKKL